MRQNVGHYEEETERESTAWKCAAGVKYLESVAGSTKMMRWEWKGN